MKTEVAERPHTFTLNSDKLDLIGVESELVVARSSSYTSRKISEITYWTEIYG